MKWLIPTLLAILTACSSPNPPDSLSDILQKTSGIVGKPEYLNSPFVAAGDRVYVVGHQDGSFPDLGWHVKGEMGGIWDHPIKLMDGFTLGISTGTRYHCLTAAKSFTNFPTANLHQYELGQDLTATRTQFVPDGLEGVIVEYTISNTSSESKNLTLEFSGMVDLRPVWLAERQNIEDGHDQGTFDEEAMAWIAKDSLNPWFTALATNQPVNAWSKPRTECSFERQGKGLDLVLITELELPAGATETVQYFIAGSYESEAKLKSTLKKLQENPAGLLEAKINRYRDITNTAQLTIPDKEIEEMYTWVKYNTDWMMREVPEVGRGLSAGIPDYPWWFGTDNTYALQGLLATGQHEEVKATIDLILKLSESVNDNGQIMHETSTNGVVFNPGNLNTTPYFTHVLWKYYEWTGDRAFLEEVYPKVQKGLAWLESQDKDGNGYPDGAGMMEIHGLHSEMIDVVVYTQAAYASAAKMADQVHDHENQAIYEEKAQTLRKKINSDWWVEHSFADFRATRSETVKLIEDAIVRADTINKPWASKELKDLKKQVGRLRDNRVQGFVVHHNWVVNTPMELGVADPEKAEKALETALNYNSNFGMYVTGIDRAESGSSSKWEVFSYVGAVMTLPTGVQAIGEARYGHPDRSLEYLKSLTNSFSYALPGSMYEVSPDYGMICQAWNIYAVGTPIIEHYFGVKPRAFEKKVIIAPNFPASWTNAKLDNVRVGDNVISIEKKGKEISVMQELDWEIVVKE